MKDSRTKKSDMSQSDSVSMAYGVTKLMRLIFFPLPSAKPGLRYIVGTSLAMLVTLLSCLTAIFFPRPDKTDQWDSYVAEGSYYEGYKATPMVLLDRRWRSSLAVPILCKGSFVYIGSPSCRIGPLKNDQRIKIQFVKIPRSFPIDSWVAEKISVGDVDAYVGNRNQMLYDWRWNSLQMVPVVVVWVGIFTTIFLSLFNYFVRSIK